MRAALPFLLAALCVVAHPRPAAAEWQFAPFIGYTFKGATTLVDNEQGTQARHWHFGGSARVLWDGPIGFEGLFLHTPGFFERNEKELTAANLQATVTESRTNALMGNVVLTIPRRWNQYGLRPYASGGLGLMHVASRDLHDIQPIDLNLVGMNVGGGGVGLVSENVGLRFDLRYFRKVQGPDEDSLDPPVSLGPIRLRYWTLSLGVVFKY